MIENGHLYIAQPPLYRIQKSREVFYAYNDSDKERILAEMAIRKPNETRLSDSQVSEESGEAIKGVSIQRYKGLGEMNPGQLWETAMDPEVRILKQVLVEDAAEANKTFDILMGAEVAPRKLFIQTHAKAVKNLDI